MYTRPEAPDYIDTKGIQLVRRDNCPLVKDVSAELLHCIMHDKDAGRAVEAARRHVLAVLDGQHPLDKFVVSKTLRGGYKNDNQPHVHVARKIAARRGCPPDNGSRVPYVFVVSDSDPDGTQAQRAEDPAHVAQNPESRLDVLHYVEHQLKSPIACLLELLVDDPEAAVFGHPDVAPRLDALRAAHGERVKVAKRTRKNARDRQPEITRWLVGRRTL
jgi:DNA polymerase delta subunit 1